MLKILVSYALGPWGLKILYFYLANAAIINTIVFIYGVVLVTAHLNYKKISDQVFDQILEINEKLSKNKVIQIDIKEGYCRKKDVPICSRTDQPFSRTTSPESVKRYMEKEKRWNELVGGRKVRVIE